VRREVVKRRVGPALYQAMEPDDQIIAGALAMSGCSPTWDVLAGGPAVASGVAGAVGLFSSYTGSPALALVGLGLSPLILVPLRHWRRPVFIAVTQRQFICYRLSKVGNEPIRLLFRAPSMAVRMTSLGCGAPRWTSVRYTGPGAGDRGLRLNVHARWRKDLDEVLAALQDSGAAVEGTPRAGLLAADMGTLPDSQRQPACPATEAAQLPGLLAAKER
jgi:hypothetical protein